MSDLIGGMSITKDKKDPYTTLTTSLLVGTWCTSTRTGSRNLAKIGSEYADKALAYKKSTLVMLKLIERRAHASEESLWRPFTWNSALMEKYAYKL